jgi:NADPH-dependent curcumin reductase CurA
LRPTPHNIKQYGLQKRYIMTKPVTGRLQKTTITTDETHRRWLLRRHPIGPPSLDDFLYAEDLVPQPPPGKMLVRALWLSLDPFQRLTWNATPRNVELIPLYSPLAGDVVGEVVVSNHPDFEVGDIINELLGWQSHAISTGKGHYIHCPEGARKVDVTLGPISTACHVLGRTGLTVYFSIVRELTPHPGQTMLISTAAGAVGSLAVQVAKIMGCHVVGLTSTDEKCRWITEELGADAAINYKRVDNLAEAIRVAAPNGVHMFYDNVGGPIAEAAAMNLTDDARITRVGIASQYSSVRQDGTPWVYPVDQPMFYVHDYYAEHNEGLAAIADWMQQGCLKYYEDIVEGLENAMSGWLDMMAGGNRGKRLVRVAEPTLS